MGPLLRSLNVALAILMSLALAFGTLEVGLRVLGFGPPPVNTEFDPALGWRGQPGSKIRRKTAEFDVTLKLDGQGLRDDFVAPSDKTKKRGTFRILALGDSFVNGYTVAREDLFLDLLEQAYKEEGRSIEIVNAGVQGYSTDQQLVWLQTHGRAFAPDLVVAFPYENDIWWNASGDYLGEAKPLLDEQGHFGSDPLPAPKPRSWLGRTAIGRIPRLFQSLPTIDVAGQKIPVEMSSRLLQPPQETLAAEAQTKLLIRRLAETAAEIGAKKFVLSPIPSRAQMAAPATSGIGAPQAGSTDAGDLAATLDPGRPYRLFEQAAAAAGATVVETLPRLRAAALAGTDVYYQRDFHLNARGNAVLASALYDGLDAWGLVPGRSGATPPAAPNAARDVGGSGWPKWPIWYLGIVGVLGTLFSRTYPNEEPQRAYLQVAALVAVVFAAALLGGGLIAALPPPAPTIAFAGLVIGMFSFIAFKLGDRIGTIFELLRSFTLRGHWYLLPLLSVLLSVGSLLVVAASSPLVAPFIYTLF